MTSFQDSLASSKTPKRALSCLEAQKLEHKNIVPTCKNSIPARQQGLSGCIKEVRIQVLRRNIFRSCFADFKRLRANSLWFSHTGSYLACKCTCLIKFCICFLSSAIKKLLGIFIILLHGDREWNKFLVLEYPQLPGMGFRHTKVSGLDTKSGVQTQYLNLHVSRVSVEM